MAARSSISSGFSRILRASCDRPVLWGQAVLWGQVLSVVAWTTRHPHSPTLNSTRRSSASVASSVPVPTRFSRNPTPLRKLEADDSQIWSFGTSTLMYSMDGASWHQVVLESAPSTP